MRHNTIAPFRRARAARSVAPRRVIVVGALGGVLVASLAGCSAPATGEASGGVAIVATTTQVGDFTNELVASDAEVTQLLEPGQSAHSFDPSAAQLLALSDADALVINGAGLESWIDDAIAASGFSGILIDASTGIELSSTPGHDDEHGDDEHAGEEHPDEHADESEAEHAEHADDDHDHDHEAGNPHIWTDPELVERMVENIARGLEQLDGLDAEALADRENAYLAQLVALDTWSATNIDEVPVEERLLVTNHDAFTYFIEAYDVTFVGSVIPSFDDNAEPSAKEIDELVADIRATGTTAVFSEATLSPKAAETIANEADVTVYSGPDALYGDSLGAAGTEGATYLGAQEHNVRLIVESWGVTPSELPKILQG